MKLRNINIQVFFLLLLVVEQRQSASADLQGPTLLGNKVNGKSAVEQKTTAEDKTPAKTHTSSETAETAQDAEKGHTTEAETSVITESSITPSNERKSDKFLGNLLSTDKDLVIDRSNFMQVVIYERWLNEKVVREKLKEQIEAIESRREPVEDIDPTPPQIEAHSMYEKAMEMLSKPQTDKRVAYTLIRKAAELNHAQARAELAWAHVLGHWLDFHFEYAANEFEDLAKQGVPEANMGLAFLYAIGVAGKNVSQPLTLIHLTLAALGDNTYAQMALGYRYSYGINVPISCEKSLSYYRKVAKKVASKITFASGPIVHRVRLLDESENPGSQETEIVDYYQLLADKGDVQAQVGLGQLYYQGGKAIQQDHQKALEYFTKAANSGNAIGFAFLGKLYLEGSGSIKADNETAFKYFKKSADLGDPVGQSGLGLMYLNGLGVPKDTFKALNYFTLAAEQGWVDGQLQLGNMYFNGNGVKTDYKLALKYYNLASQSGHVLAYYNLGMMHAYGMGMHRSCPAAVEYFKNVAERGRWSATLMRAYSDYKNGRIVEAYMQYALLAEMGYEVAQSNAAYLLDRGDIGLFHNRHEELIRAFYYWKRAAAQGYSAAQVKLGDYYYYGWGSNIDFETAAALYRKASEQQYNAQAMFNLGYMHEQGLGMKKDWHLAKRLYDLAAETNTDAKVPVAIALFKLQILANMEAIKESPYRFIFYMDENIAANWDLYMITILTLLLGVIMYSRRPYQQQQQEQPQPQANVNQPLDGNLEQATALAGTAMVVTSTNDNATNTTETTTIADNSLKNKASTSTTTTTAAASSTSNTVTTAAAHSSTADPID